MAQWRKVNSRFKIHYGAISTQGVSWEYNTWKATEHACVWPRKDLDSPQLDFHVGSGKQIQVLVLAQQAHLEWLCFSRSLF